MLIGILRFQVSIHREKLPPETEMCTTFCREYSHLYGCFFTKFELIIAFIEIYSALLIIFILPFFSTRTLQY